MRNLSESEIKALELNGCRCSGWSLIEVTDKFDPSRYRDVSFSGHISLGAATGTMVLPGTGIPAETGIYNARLHECAVGAEVYIGNIGQGIAFCNIGDGTIISNTALITMGQPGDTPVTFGEGTPVNVLDETGSLAVRIFHGLSAAVAQLITETTPEMRDKINDLTRQYALGLSGDRCEIGRCVKIQNTGELIQVRIGDFTDINGASRLENGSVFSSEDAPVCIGENVVAHDFIIAEGADITDSTHIEQCYVGQSAILHNFTAQDTMMFANSCLMNGESCAVIAGPYTKSDHKSSLLIGGRFMMFNAGSGTNQSNHLYKMGPTHHGTMGRGAKCASDTYVMWPAAIGDFTLVAGRHYCHPDTREFPFSFLVADRSGCSRLIPGLALNSCGTVRDIEKWPKRDKRTASQTDDIISFEAFNPSVIINILRGIERLKEIIAGEPDKNGDYVLDTMMISRKAAERGIHLYSHAIARFLGEAYVRNLETGRTPQPGYLPDRWVDLSGLVVPQSMIDEVLENVKSGTITSPAELTKAVAALKEKAEEAALKATDAALLIRKKAAGEGNYVKELLGQWIESVEEHAESVMADARKEAVLRGIELSEATTPLFAKMRRLVEDAKKRAEAILAKA